MEQERAILQQQGAAHHGIKEKVVCVLMRVPSDLASANAQKPSYATLKGGDEFADNPLVRREMALSQQRKQVSDTS